MNKNAISPYGIFSCIMIGRLINSVMIIVTSDTVFADSDLILRPFWSAVVVLIVGIPVFLYIKHFRVTGITEAAAQIKPVYGKVMACLYYLIYIYIGIRATSRFDLFTSSVMLPDINMTVFIVILLIVCTYNAMLGLRTIGRTSLFLLTFVGLIIFVIIIFSLKEVDFLNLTPFFVDGVGTFVKDVFISASYFFDLGMIPLLLSKIKGNTTKAFTVYIITVSLLTTFEGFMLVSTLGNFVNIQLFPSFSISSIGNIGIFKRLDAAITSVWIFGIVIRLTFIIYICTNMLSVIFPKLKKGTRSAVVLASIGGVSLFVSNSISRYSILLQRYTLMIICFFLLSLFPGVILIAHRKKERNNKNNEEKVVY